MPFLLALLLSCIGFAGGVDPYADSTANCWQHYSSEDEQERKETAMVCVCMCVLCLGMSGQSQTNGRDNYHRLIISQSDKPMIVLLIKCTISS